MKRSQSFVHVIYCDADISSVEVFERAEPIKLHPQGGGGTDFRPPFEHVEREGLTPACFIYLTDDASYPKQPADFPTLWCNDNQTDRPLALRPQIQS